jgi:tripartite-type tricarboxylate transporter receptor subunit TctC
LHLAAERIFNKLGVKARPIPFAGANENLNTLLAGSTDIYAASMAPILPYVKQGTIKCLLLTSAERNRNLPNTDSLTDLGIAAEETNVWRGVIAPEGIPADRVAKLERAFERAAKDPRFAKFAESRGEEALGEDGDAERKLIDQEYAALGKIVTMLGLQKK